MSRAIRERLTDILTAIDRCRKYETFLSGDGSVTREMSYDAILRNLAVIGEAVRSLPDALKLSSPQIAWHSIAGLRNIVVHEYFRVEPELIVEILQTELTKLEIDVRRQLAQSAAGEP